MARLSDEVDQLRALPPYQRMLKWWSASTDPQEAMLILDDGDYDPYLFRPPIALTTVVGLHDIVPAYGSPDGVEEMGNLIRDLEYERLCVAGVPAQRATYRALVDEAGIGGGNGATNVVYALLRTIIDRRCRAGASTRALEVVVTTPTCSVYLEQAPTIGDVEVKQTVASHDHPGAITLEDVIAVVSEQTVVVLLTSPSNPADQMIDAAQMKAIVAFCQERQIYLIVDAVFQDLVRTPDHGMVEPLGVTASLDYVVKVYSCSKDTPTMSGYRFGYWIGDPVLQGPYRELQSRCLDSLSTVALAMNCYTLLFKLLYLQQRQAEVDDMAYFADGVFGYQVRLDAQKLFKEMQYLDVGDQACSTMRANQRRLGKTLAMARDYVLKSSVFAHSTSGNIGNSLLVQVNPDAFPGDSIDLLKMTSKSRCQVLSGDMFGMPLQKRNAWFRVTATHVEADQLIQGLARIEDAVLTN